MNSPVSVFISHIQISETEIREIMFGVKLSVWMKRLMKVFFCKKRANSIASTITSVTSITM
ncbi:hypothetical protein D3C80_1914800 [compost metagenome]